MNESDLSNIDPHQTGLLAGLLLGGGSVIFGLIAVAILLSGDTSFEVVRFGLGIDNEYLRILLVPFVTFVGGYAFAFTVCSVIRWVLGRDRSNP